MSSTCSFIFQKDSSTVTFTSIIVEPRVGHIGECRVSIITSSPANDEVVLELGKWAFWGNSYLNIINVDVNISIVTNCTSSKFRQVVVEITVELSKINTQTYVLATPTIAGTSSELHSV